MHHVQRPTLPTTAHRLLNFLTWAGGLEVNAIPLDHSLANWVGGDVDPVTHRIGYQPDPPTTFKQTVFALQIKFVLRRHTHDDRLDQILV